MEIKSGSEKKYQNVVGPYEIVGVVGDTIVELKDPETNRKFKADRADLELVAQRRIIGKGM